MDDIHLGGGIWEAWACPKVWGLVLVQVLTSSVTGGRISLPLVLFSVMEGVTYIISKASSFLTFSEVRHESHSMSINFLSQNIYYKSLFNITPFLDKVVVKMYNREQ